MYGSPQSKLKPDKLGPQFELKCQFSRVLFPLLFDFHRTPSKPTLSVSTIPRLSTPPDSEGLLRREGHRPAKPPPRLQHRLTANSEFMHSFTYPSLQMICVGSSQIPNFDLWSITNLRARISEQTLKNVFFADF